MAAATAAYAGVIEPLGLKVTPYALTPPGWRAGHKLTVTVIADLHAGGPDMLLPHIAEVVDTANALHSDLIVLLGDFKAWYKFKTEPVADPDWAAELARLKAPLGTWAILGNHDWWHDLEGVRNVLAAERIPLLQNDVVLIGEPGRRFWLAGLGDQLAHWVAPGRFQGVDDLPGTMAKINTDDPVLLLAHEPDIFPKVPHASRSRLPAILMAARFACLSLAAFCAVAIRRALCLWPCDRERSTPDRFRRARHQHHSGAVRRAAGNRAHHARRLSLGAKKTAPAKAGAATHPQVVRKLSTDFTGTP